MVIYILTRHYVAEWNPANQADWIIMFSPDTGSSSSSAPPQQLAPPLAPPLAPAPPIADPAPVGAPAPLIAEAYPPLVIHTRLQDPAIFGNVNFEGLTHLAGQAGNEIASLDDGERAWHLCEMFELFAQSAWKKNPGGPGDPSFKTPTHKEHLKAKIRQLDITGANTVTDTDGGYQKLGALYAYILKDQPLNGANGRGSYLMAKMLADMHGIPLPAGEVFAERADLATRFQADFARKAQPHRIPP